MWQQLQASSNRRIKESKFRVDDFQFIALAGKGAFGKVWKVAHKETGKIYAMKCMKKKDVVKQDFVSHTNCERQIMADLAFHPFILGMHHSFQTEDGLFIIMDYLPGGTLFQLLAAQPRPFTFKACQFYAAEILLGLEALHQYNIVYRDLKLENVMLDLDGHIKLADFGLSAKLVNSTDKVRSFSGTAYYLAPEIVADRKIIANNIKKRKKNKLKGAKIDVLDSNELPPNVSSKHHITSKNDEQANGEKAVTSVAEVLEGTQGHSFSADIWCFGVLVFFMLTQDPPFYDENRMELMRQILHEEPDYKFYTFLSPTCISLLKGLLKKDIKKRLGCGPKGIAEIKAHPFFIGIDWKKALAKKIKPLLIPKPNFGKPVSQEQQENIFVEWKTKRKKSKQGNEIEPESPNEQQEQQQPEEYFPPDLFHGFSFVSNRPSELEASTAHEETNANNSGDNKGKENSVVGVKFTFKIKRVDAIGTSLENSNIWVDFKRTSTKKEYAQFYPLFVDTIELVNETPLQQYQQLVQRGATTKVACTKRQVVWTEKNEFTTWCNLCYDKKSGKYEDTKKLKLTIKTDNKKFPILGTVLIDISEHFLSRQEQTQIFAVQKSKHTDHKHSTLVINMQSEVISINYKNLYFVSEFIKQDNEEELKKLEEHVEKLKTKHNVPEASVVTLFSCKRKFLMEQISIFDKQKPKQVSFTKKASMGDAIKRKSKTFTRGHRRARSAGGGGQDLDFLNNTPTIEINSADMQSTSSTQDQDDTSESLETDTSAKEKRSLTKSFSITDAINTLAPPKVEKKKKRSGHRHSSSISSLAELLTGSESSESATDEDSITSISFTGRRGWNKLRMQFDLKFIKLSCTKTTSASFLVKEKASEEQKQFYFYVSWKRGANKSNAGKTKKIELDYNVDPASNETIVCGTFPSSTSTARLNTTLWQKQKAPYNFESKNLLLLLKVVQKAHSPTNIEADAPSNKTVGKLQLDLAQFAQNNFNETVERILACNINKTVSGVKFGVKLNFQLQFEVHCTWIKLNGEQLPTVPLSILNSIKKDKQKKAKAEGRLKQSSSVSALQAPVDATTDSNTKTVPHAKYTALLQQKKKYKEKCTKLHEDKTKLKGTVGTLTSQNKQLHDRNVELEQELNLLTAKHAKLIEAQGTKKKKQRIAKQKQHSPMVKRKNSAQAEMQRNKSELLRQEQEIATKINSFQQQVDNFTKQQESHTLQMAKENEEMAALRLQNDTLAQQLSLQQEKLFQEKTQQKVLLEQLNEEKKRFEAEKDIFAKEKDDLLRRKDKLLSTENSKAQEAWELIKQDKAALEEDQSSFKLQREAQLEEIRIKEAKLETDKCILEREQTILLQKVAELDKQKEAFEKQAAALQEKSLQAEQKHQTKQAKLNSKVAKLKKEQCLLSEAQASHQQASDLLQRQQHSLQEKQQTIAEHQCKLDSSMLQLQEKEDALIKQSSNIAESRSEIEKKQNQLYEKLTSATDKERALDEKLRQVSDDKKRLDTLQQQLLAEKLQIQQQQLQQQSIAKENEKKKEEIATSMAQLNYEKEQLSLEKQKIIEERQQIQQKTQEMLNMAEAVSSQATNNEEQQQLLQQQLKQALQVEQEKQAQLLQQAKEQQLAERNILEEEQQRLKAEVAKLKQQQDLHAANLLQLRHKEDDLQLQKAQFLEEKEAQLNKSIAEREALQNELKEIEAQRNKINVQQEEIQQERDVVNSKLRSVTIQEATIKLEQEKLEEQMGDIQYEKQAVARQLELLKTKQASLAQQTENFQRLQQLNLKLAKQKEATTTNAKFLEYDKQQQQNLLNQLNMLLLETVYRFPEVNNIISMTKKSFVAANYGTFNANTSVPVLLDVVEIEVMLNDKAITIKVPTQVNKLFTFLNNTFSELNSNKQAACFISYTIGAISTTALRSNNDPLLLMCWISFLSAFILLIQQELGKIGQQCLLNNTKQKNIYQVGISRMPYHKIPETEFSSDDDDDVDDNINEDRNSDNNHAVLGKLHISLLNKLDELLNTLFAHLLRSCNEEVYYYGLREILHPLSTELYKKSKQPSEAKKQIGTIKSKQISRSSQLIALASTKANQKAIDNICLIFKEKIYLIAQCNVFSSIERQLLSEMCKAMNISLFNTIMTNPLLCCIECGYRVKLAVSQVIDFLTYEIDTNNDAYNEAAGHLDKIKQLADALNVLPVTKEPKSEQNENSNSATNSSANFSASDLKHFPSLNVAQLKHVIDSYTTSVDCPTVIPTAVYNTIDALCVSTPNLGQLAILLEPK